MVLEVEWRVSMRPGRRRKLEPGAKRRWWRREGVGESQGGAPIPEAEAGCSVTARFATGGWRRTWSGWRCCSGWVTC